MSRSIADHPLAFATDTWYFTYEATESTHRESHVPGPQHASADLPEEVFRAFLCNVTARFKASTRERWKLCW